MFEWREQLSKIGILIHHPFKNNNNPLPCPYDANHRSVSALALLSCFVSHPCGRKVVASFSTRAQWLCILVHDDVRGFEWLGVENLAMHSR